MAPFVEREWGAKATELMRRVKRLADPDGVLGPGVVINDDPGAHLRNLKTTPSIEDVGRHLRRVRLLRAGLPQPPPDHHPAPADRAAPRDGPPGARAPRCSRRCWRSSSTTRSRPAPPTAPACSPARSGSTPASSSRACARAALRARRAASRCGWRGRWDGGRARRAGEPARRRRGGVARAAMRGASRATRAALELRAAARSGRANMPHPAPAPAAGRPRREGAAAVYVPACVNRIFGRARGAGTGRRACPRRWSRSRRAPGCRCGSPPTSPGTAARRHGRRRATSAAPGGWPTTRVDALWRWSGGGELPIVCDASSCTLGLAAEAVPLLSEVNAERHAKLEIVDSIAWAASACCRG